MQNPDMQPSQRPIIFVLDDRELVSPEVRALVGNRRYGSIMLRHQNLAQHIEASLPDWLRPQLFHVRSSDDLIRLRKTLESSAEDCALCVLAARAGFLEPERLRQLCERLPYAEEDFTDRLYQPLLVFMRNAHQLVREWPAFESMPLHCREQSWQGSQRLRSVLPLDLAEMRDFLALINGATPTRHFNTITADGYYFIKSSQDRGKIRAEYDYFQLVPEAMRPWLVQPFDYQEDAHGASYRMLRYYLADTALQWVHGAFEPRGFTAFVDRLLFFVSQRPQMPCSAEDSLRSARSLFIDKLAQRSAQFLGTPEGRRINTLASSAAPELDIEYQLARLGRLFERSQAQFARKAMVVGHGDPCFSNILYDQQRDILKLIDPKGASSQDALWTHPLYDLCKISHSVLGDYDFINNGLYQVRFDSANQLALSLEQGNQDSLKQIFIQRVAALGFELRAIRLGEASLFLSMLPLHLDHPNKVMAFMLRAKQILDEVEHGA